MSIFDRFNSAVVVAGAGLCGVALALSPQVAAAPLITGGEDYACIESSAGELPGGAAAAAPCAPLSEMAGVPMALPGPVPVAPPVPVVPPVPLAPPVPVAPPVPIVPPVPLAPPVPVAPVAGAPVGAPLTQMGGAGGKGELTGPPAPGAPVSGEPIWPGPAN